MVVRIRIIFKIVRMATTHPDGIPYVDPLCCAKRVLRKQKSILAFTPNEGSAQAMGAPIWPYGQKRQKLFKVKITRFAVGNVHGLVTIVTMDNVA